MSMRIVFSKIAVTVLVACLLATSTGFASTGLKSAGLASASSGCTTSAKCGHETDPCSTPLCPVFACTFALIPSIAHIPLPQAIPFLHLSFPSKAMPEPFVWQVYRPPLYFLTRFRIIIPFYLFFSMLVVATVTVSPRWCIPCRM